jgi:hypothetical protein
LYPLDEYTLMLLFEVICGGRARFVNIATREQDHWVTVRQADTLLERKLNSDVQRERDARQRHHWSNSTHYTDDQWYPRIGAQHFEICSQGSPCRLTCFRIERWDVWGWIIHPSLEPVMSMTGSSRPFQSNVRLALHMTLVGSGLTDLTI